MMEPVLSAELARVEAERLNLANLITHYWIPRAEHLQAEVRRLTAALQRRTADTVRDWRATMEHPCTCPPRPSTDECPRVEECYEAWSAARNDGEACR